MWTIFAFNIINLIVNLHNLVCNNWLIILKTRQSALAARTALHPMRGCGFGVKYLHCLQAPLGAERLVCLCNSLVSDVAPVKVCSESTFKALADRRMANWAFTLQIQVASRLPGTHFGKSPQKVTNSFKTFFWTSLAKVSLFLCCVLRLPCFPDSL